MAGFQIIAAGGKLFDGVAAIQQFALVTIYVSNRRLASRSGEKARVVGEHAGLRIKLANVHHIGPHAALINRQLDVGAAIAE